jgi:hypothetical protein
MGWVKWLIPLVVVFVIILSNLAKITQEEKKNVPRRRPRPAEDNPPRPRRSPGEIDKFLEEINRRRREGTEQRQPVAAERPPAPSPRPVAERRPRREVPSLTQDIPSVVPATVRSPAPAPPSVVLMPAKQPVPAERGRPAVMVEQVVVASAVPPLPAAPAAAGGVAPGAPAAVVALKPDTPTAVLLRQLLRSPQSLKTAIVLREVLDGPLCRRGPGRALPRRTGAPG